MFSDQYNVAVKEMELAEISKDNMRINRCPNCETVEAYVADRCNFVICRQCHMTGPVGHSEEEAVELWNRLPRRGDVEVTVHPKCDRCGCEIVPGLVHYCMPVIEEGAVR